MNITWHKIADQIGEIVFSKDGIANVVVEEKKICMVLFKGEIYACQSACPHAGGELSKGYLDAMGNIVCPVHRYKFDIKNGRNTSGEGYHLRRYEVVVRADGVYIALP